MLCLSRKKDESILIGDCIVTIVEVRGNTVRLGVQARKEVPIHRAELLLVPEVARLHGMPCALLTPEQAAKAG